MNKHILAFRVFDFRDRFPMPFATFTQALEALQSPRAHMPECGEIICYLNNGQKIVIPRDFFIERKLRFRNIGEAKKWLINRNNMLEQSPENSIIQYLDMNAADQKKTFNEQLEEALLFMDEAIIPANKNADVAKAVELYLVKQISLLMNEVEMIHMEVSGYLSGKEVGNINDVHFTSQPVVDENHVLIKTIMNIRSKHPEYRLMQLLVNAIQPRESCSELFYLEDNALLKKLNKM